MFSQLVPFIEVILLTLKEAFKEEEKPEEEGGKEGEGNGELTEPPTLPWLLILYSHIYVMQTLQLSKSWSLKL